MSNSIAPEGQVFVCCACGKRSKDKYGDHPIDLGWDASCMMHAILVHEDTINIGPNGRVIRAEAVDIPKPEDTIEENLKRCGAVGPGSFTGVRVALSMAQGLLVGLGICRRRQ